VIAYFIFSLSLSAGIALRLGRVHDDLCQCYWPEFYSQDLELTLRPSTSFGATGILSNITEHEWLNNMIAFTGGLRFIAYVVGPLAFEVYTLITLGRSSDISTSAFIVATTLTVALLLACLPNMLFLAVAVGKL
jgi:hypothetical protein